MQGKDYSQLIKAEAQRIGFFHCGISKAGFLEEEAPRLEKWLRSNMHGSMSYMERNFDKRLDPRLLVDGAKSVISLLLNYFPEQKQIEGTYKISKYAYGEDYHFVIKRKLKELSDFIKANIGDVNGRAFVDSAPVLDRAWAKKSGLGWVGKNSNLINPKAGSFFFIAELIVDLELTADPPMKDYCGTCRRCIDSCPTQAIVKPYVVDGSKCISYLTIELKENISPEFKNKMEDWIFGCDACQDVCPWNSFSKPHTENSFIGSETLLKMEKKEWTELTEYVFENLFKNSAVQRTQFEGMIRNIKFVNREL